MVKKRAKSLKSMTVSELVNERQKHSDRINQIDEILRKATEALGQRVVEEPRYVSSTTPNPNSSTLLGATSVPNKKYSQTAPMSLNPPTVNPVGYSSKGDLVPAFTLFDADADAKQRALQEEATDVEYAPSDINNEDLITETNELKKQLSQELNTINDIPIPTPVEGEPEGS